MTDWKSQLRECLSSLSADPSREADIVDELAQHLADVERAALGRRVTPEEARTAAINRLPLEGGHNSTAIVEGRDPQQERGPLVETRPITAGYFDAMGIPLLSGRALGALDGTPASLLVVVVNEAMARRC